MSEYGSESVPKKYVLPYGFCQYSVAMGLDMPYLAHALGDSRGVGGRTESRGIYTRWHSEAGSSCGVITSPRPFFRLITGLDGVLRNSLEGAVMSRMSRRHSQHSTHVSKSSTAPPDSPGRHDVALDPVTRALITAGSQAPACASFAHLG
jgi:hypothetical protein